MARAAYSQALPLAAFASRLAQAAGPSINYRQVTESYLLSLGVYHQRRFVSLDARVGLQGVPGQRSEHLVIL